MAAEKIEKIEKITEYPGVPDRADERDVPVNPYPRDPQRHLGSAVEGVRFESKASLDVRSHQYFLQDENGQVYTDYILSGSNLVQYASLLLLKPDDAEEYLREQNKPQPVLLVAMASHQHRDLSDEPPYVDLNSTQVAAQLGTRFHWYVERRIKKLPVNIPLYIEKEVAQFEKFYARLCDDFFPICEMSIGSLRHKICGTIDAAHFDGNEYQIWDWKNSKHVFDSYEILHESEFVPRVNGKRTRKSNHFYYSRNTRISPHYVAKVLFHPCVSSMTKATFTKFIQTAAYRKIMILSGMPCSTKAYIGNVHPTMFTLPGEEEPELRIVELDLARPLANYGGKSAIEIVQWIFDTNERILAKLIGECQST